MNNNDSNVEDELIEDDGQLHCPIDGCEWWVPDGMGYCYPDHREYHEELHRAYSIGFRSPRGSQKFDYRLFQETNTIEDYLEEME